jgi:transcriptional regulator with XRE-family HTH domain
MAISTITTGTAWLSMQEDAVRALGRFVRQLRDELGLNQTELGERIGRDQKTISNIERGAVTTFPDRETLRALAAALYVTTSDLLQAAGYLDTDTEDEPDTEFRLWAGKVGDFTPEERAIVDAVIEQIRANKRRSRDGVDR